MRRVVNERDFVRNLHYSAKLVVCTEKYRLIELAVDPHYFSNLLHASSETMSRTFVLAILFR